MSMDAHTLNAWTRFALQKGGIGSCTALIDNPATDLEDLMFMAGEKIVVLRRLDEDPSDPTKARSNVGNDAESWFLGYCEGVVGRFKGSHVQFDGKLKKPVLMRRSGVGAIRESTLRPMSKSEAAKLHASQVPPGMPVSAIDSDEEDSTDLRSQSDTRSRSNGPSLDEQYPAHGIPPRIASHAASTSTRNYPKSAAMASTSSANGQALHTNMARLGVTTPPLSDETHARATASSHRRSDTIDSDSDESDTHLPWARASTASSKSTGSNEAAIEGVLSTLRRPNLTRGPANGHSGPTPTDARTVLPPSPISSAESPLHSKPENSLDRMAQRSRASGAGHTPNQSSISTVTTSESEEDTRRKDHTLSIYEIYGRDSVAFPNFDFRALNGKGSRMISSKSSESMRSLSKGTVNPPAMPRIGSGEDASSQRQIPNALRAPSQKRPTAAPPLPTPSGLSMIRKKTDSNGSSAMQHPTPPGDAMVAGGTGAFGAFDPRRRPSMGAINVSRAPPVRGPMSAQEPSTGSMPPPMAGPPAMGVPPGQAAMLPPGPRPFGSNLLARRAQEGQGPRPTPEGPPAGMQIDTNLARPAMQSTHSFIRAVDGALPSPSAANFLPHRSSSDRSSQRERIGSGQLKKNPSNPQPGPHGGMQGLMIPNMGPGPSSAGGRSPSPLSSPANSMVGPPTPNGPLSISPGQIMNPGGPMATSPSHISPPPPFGMPPGGQAVKPAGLSTPVMQSPSMMPRSMPGSPVPPPQRNPANFQFDPLGFIVGSSPPMPMPHDDPNEIKQWRQVLAENDVAAARKNRKVKKMIKNGIPRSMRAEVWLFLASAHLRRRPGLFEELCKVSQSAKSRRENEAHYEAIEKDLERAYPDHKLFMGPNSSGVADLEAILKAYVHYNPLIGYTQGMNLVAGFLLMQMPAEEAFWLLCALLRDIHMEGYYAGDMKQLHVDGIIFGQLLQQMDGELAGRLIELGIEPFNFAPNWLLPLFSRILPWPTLLRAWDMFFFEGPSWILRLALAVIRVLRDPLMDRRTCPGTGEALRLLLHPPQHLLTPDNVIPCALTVKLKEGDVRKLSRQASKLVRNTIVTPNVRGRPPSQTGPGNGATSRASSQAPVGRRAQQAVV